MKVLVVAKKTNLEVHGEIIKKRVKAGLVDSTYFHLLEKTHEEHYQTLESLKALLSQFQIEYTNISRGLFWPDFNGIAAVITVGGDGTILEASHHIVDKPIPLIGIRSAESSIGKLCSCRYQGMENLVRSLAEQTLETVLVGRLKAEVSSAATGTSVLTEPVLNDFLFTNISPAATTRYKLLIGKKKAEQRSSGLWISTPSGSTAAIHAAGGSIMDLKDRNFQFKVRELYDSFPQNSNGPVSNGLFNPDLEGFKIVNFSEKAKLYEDGLHGTVTLEFGDSIRFLRAPDLRLAVPEYYKTNPVITTPKAAERGG